MLGCLRRRGARKTPKRLRALRFRTVGPWLYLGPGRRKTVGVVGANPLRSYFRGALPTARMLGETQVGVRDRQTPGESRPRKGDGVSRRARRRSRGCARTLFVSFAEVDKRPWLREALSPIRSPSNRRTGDAVDGSLAYGCTESFQVESAVTGGPVFRTRLFAAKLRVAEGAVGDEKVDSR